MPPVKTALLILGLILLLIATGCFGFSALGFAGFVADAEYAVNRNFGVTMGISGLAALAAGVVLCLPGLLHLRKHGFKFNRIPEE